MHVPTRVSTYVYVHLCMCVQNPLEAHLSSLDGWSLGFPAMVPHSFAHSFYTHTHTTHTRRIYSILIEFQFSISPFNWIQWKSVDETVFSALYASLPLTLPCCPAVAALCPSSALPVTQLLLSLLLLLFIQLLPSPREPRLPALMAPTMPH